MATQIANSTGVVGSAGIQSKLWGADARNWGKFMEDGQRPLYEAVLGKVNKGTGTSILDVGCGSGLFCAIASQAGVAISGLDATPELIEIARERVPQGDLRVGEMEDLPYDDHTFDVVTGFNSFQYAAKPVHALEEAGRVARQGGRVVIAVWGNAEACEATAYLGALGRNMPPPPPGAPGPFALSPPGALENLVTQAGLQPVAQHDVECPWVFPNLKTALLALLSAGPATKAIANAGRGKVEADVAEAIAPFLQSDGSYRLENVFRFLIATKG